MMETIDLNDSARLDFNLAVTFLALWQERNVSRAAQRLLLSQSAVSAALARLRTVTGDPLFVRLGGAMQPTPRAEAMAAAVQGGLEQVQRAFLVPPPFDPAQTQRAFTLAMSDDFQIAVGPDIARALDAEAPAAVVRFRQSSRTTVEAMIAAGEADLAVVAHAPEGAGLCHQAVAEGGFALVFDAAACGAVAPLDVPTWLGLPHVLVSFNGRTGIVDDVLAPLGLTRRVQTALTHFAALPPFLLGRRAVATLPAHAAARLAAFSGLTVSPPPLPMGGYQVSLLWRKDQDADPASQWLRRVIGRCVAAGVGGPAMPGT